MIPMEEQALRHLIGTLRDAQEDLAAQHGKRVPMLVKVAPDLSDDDIDAVARVLGDLAVDGVIATNTTVSRISVQDHKLARETGGLMQGVYSATDYWWTVEDKYPLAKMFNDAFSKKYGYKPEWGAENSYISFAHWARMVEEAGTFYPPDVIKTYEKEETIPSFVGDVHYRKEDHQCVRPVIIVKGKMDKDMKGKEDYYDIVEIVPGAGLMQKPDAFGCNLGDYT